MTPRDFYTQLSSSSCVCVSSPLWGSVLPVPSLRVSKEKEPGLFMFLVWCVASLHAPPAALESQRKSADVRGTVDVLRKLKMWVSKPGGPSFWVCSKSIFTSMIIATAGTTFTHSLKNASFPFLSFMSFSVLSLEVEVNYVVSAAQHGGPKRLSSWVQTGAVEPTGLPPGNH